MFLCPIYRQALYLMSFTLNKAFALFRTLNCREPLPIRHTEKQGPGTQRWDAKVGRKSGTQRLDAKVGRNGETQRRDAKVGRKNE